MINKDIINFNKKVPGECYEICEMFAREISRNLPKCENKIWHSVPVWLDNGNSLAGDSVCNAGW